MNQRFLFLLTFFSCLFYYVEAQNKQVYTLEDVLEIATSQSLDAFKAENAYMASYWEFRSYKSSLLPHLDANFSPFTYTRSVTQRYDIEQNIEVYRPQQTLNTYGAISLSQLVAPTGGELSVISNINRLKNFNADQSENYSVTPISLGFSQPLFAFNEYKWNQKIEPLKFQKARKELVYNQQQIKLLAVSYFFAYAMASEQLKMAELTQQNNDELLHLGKKRFELLSIDQTELLKLELNVENASIKLAQAKQDYAKAAFDLTSFLRLDVNQKIDIQLPSNTLGIQIDAQEAVDYASVHSPELMQVRQDALEADMTLDQVIKENRLSVSIAASYGLNQQAENVSSLYNDMLDQQLVAIDIQLPIFDWGERKGRREMAYRQKEVTSIELSKTKSDFERNVKLKVTDFNIQERVVHSAAKAESIAKQTYELTERRFRSGQVDVMQLNAANEASQTALTAYIDHLQTYWQLYFEICQLTLFDFKSATLLEDQVNFDFTHN